MQCIHLSAVTLTHDTRKTLQYYGRTPTAIEKFNVEKEIIAHTAHCHKRTIFKTATSAHQLTKHRFKWTKPLPLIQIPSQKTSGTTNCAELSCALRRRWAQFSFLWRWNCGRMEFVWGSTSMKKPMNKMRHGLNDPIEMNFDGNSQLFVFFVSDVLIWFFCSSRRMQSPVHDGNTTVWTSNDAKTWK